MRNIYKCRVCGAYTEEPIHCGTPAQLLLEADRRVRLSKLLSYILRHDPSSVGISLDEEGWVPIEVLVRAIRDRWRCSNYSWLTSEHIVAVALLDPKGRFELRGGAIRARYGHSRSVRVNIRYPVDRTVRVLYHGTEKRYLKSILSEGIKPMKRLYVHLSATVSDACAVGRRHGPEPVVLVVDAECVRLHRYVLKASPRVYLTEFVEPECIKSVLSCGEASSEPP